VVRALARTPSRAALESLSSWLGRREELDVGILLALGSLHAFVDRERDEDLVREVQSYLSSRDSTRIQAAATALGRLGTAESVPWLIELLVHEDAPVQRTALAALRSIGGVRLPGSVSAWRAWYAREETWFQEHAPALLEELVTAEESEEATTRVRAVLASLTEHRLHRDELFTHLEPLFAHERPRLRVLACQAAERLASRRALPTLVAMLRDVEENVVSAACAALRTFEGVILPPDPLVWSQRLGLALSQDGS
jgi:HEAT repeat protein